MKLTVKICGLTTLSDARAALEAGADDLGFVFYAGSPRAVSPAAVAGILRALAVPVNAVGVFVNASPAEILGTVRICGLSVVQLHGDEPAAAGAGMPVPVWRAVSCDAGHWNPSPEAWPAARYVVDAAAGGRYGGTGSRSDWVQAAALARGFPVLLAGGLRPDNVKEAIRQVRPLGVDVSSGVESSPGIKSQSALRAFIHAVRQMETETAGV